MKHYRPVARGGAGGLGGLVFGQTVNPISTRGADYAHHSPTSPPGFSDLATALQSDEAEVTSVCSITSKSANSAAKGIYKFLGTMPTCRFIFLTA